MRKAKLDRRPLEVINHLLTTDRVSTPCIDPIDSPVWFRGPSNWSKQNNSVMSAAVRDHGQMGNEHYIQADIAVGRDPIEATEAVFEALFWSSYDTAVERAGGSDLPDFQLIQIVAGSATAATKKVWTTWAVEDAISRNEDGERAADEDFAAAVERERGERVDIQFTDGRRLQVKAVAGSKDSTDVAHIWHENFEDYYDRTTVRYSRDKSELR